MAQQYITFGGVQIVQPDEMVPLSWETTYSSDSGRVQTGPAVMSPLFTVEAYSLKWSRLTLAEASQILNAGANRGDLVHGRPFSVHYPSAISGGWQTKSFYAGKGSLDWSRMNFEDELIEGLSFNIIGVNPI